MTDSADTEHVQTLDAFADHLRRLAHSASTACGDGSAVDAEAWINVEVTTFLWAWVGVLSSGIRHDIWPWSGEPSGVPGWHGLAVQLDLARTAKPGFNCVLADSGMHAGDVTTANDLRMYLAQTATDFARDRRETAAAHQRGEWTGDGGAWAHHTLSDWLEGWAAWLHDNRRRPIAGVRLEPVTWQSIASQIAAAQVYE